MADQEQQDAIMEGEESDEELQMALLASLMEVWNALMSASFFSAVEAIGPVV